MLKIKDVSKLRPRQKRNYEYLLKINKNLAFSYLGNLSGVFNAKNYQLNGYLENFNRNNKLWSVNETRKKLLEQNISKTQVMKLFREFKNPEVNHVPYPTKLGEWIGVEIECFIPIKSLVRNAQSIEPCGDCDDCSNEDYQACEDNQIDAQSDNYDEKLCELVKINNISGVTIKSDGSIEQDSNCYPVECTIVFQRLNPEPLRKLCQLLNDLGTRVNKTCGLHVHLDIRDLALNKNEIRKRGRRLKNSLEVLKQLIPKSRIGNTFCKLGMSQMRRNSDRYYAVNMTSVLKHKTIEIRLHSGTTDFNKIYSWVSLLYNISRCNKLSQPKIKPTTLDMLWDKLYPNKNDANSERHSLITMNMYNYFVARIEKFKPTETGVIVEESSGISAA